MQSASTNITTFPGKVGISNANPTHTLAIGSNVYVDDTGSNKLTVTGVISGDGLGISNIQTANVLGLTDNVMRITTLETDLDNNSSRVTTVSADLADNSSRISTVSSDLADNSSRITTVSSDLSDNSSRIDSLGDGAHTFTGVKTFEDDIILESNLRVNGSLTYANTVNMIVSDPIMELGANNQHTNDLGLVLTRHGNLGNDSNVAIFYDESQDNLKIGYTDNSASETTLTTTATGLDVSITGNVAAAYDTDETSYFGRAAVGYMGQSDQASFSHLDKNTSANFALKQAASGATHINTPTGQHIRFSVNASEVGRFTGGGDFKVGANKLYVDTSASEVQMYSQATGSTAGPDLVLMRNNPNNGSNNEYIGQIRYEGLSDTGNSRLYAKTTGKIKTATNGSEDGVIETMIKTGGSNRISVRHSGAKFLIQKGTDLQVGEVANLYVDTSTSRVGVGMSNPSYTLDVDGDINLSGDFYQGGSPFVSSLWTSSGTDLYYSSGSVGISNAAPDHDLSVGSNLYVHDTGSNVLVVDGNVNVSNTLTAHRLTLNNVSITTTMDLAQVSNVGNVTSNVLQFTNPTTAFVTTGNVEVGTANLFVDTTTGRVGIGTSSPDEKLHVHANDSSHAQLTLRNENATARTGIHIQNAAGDNFNIQHVGGAGQSSNAAIIENFSTTNGGIEFYNKGDGKYTFRTTDSNNLRFSILNNGNVGVGGITPSSKLHVDGDVRMKTLSTNVIGEITPVYVRGTGNNNPANRIVRIGDTTHVNGTGRGLTLTIINASTHAHVSSVIYDTYGFQTSSDALATALEGMTDAQIGILTSYDAFEGNMTGNLVTACFKLGLTRLAGANDDLNRHPYCAIFYGPGASGVAGNHAIEVMKSDNSSGAYATLSTFLVDDSFMGQTVTNALYSGTGDDTTPTVFVSKDKNVGIGLGTTYPSRSLHVSRSVSYPSNGSAVEIIQRLGTNNYIYEGQHRAQLRINNQQGTYSNRSLEFALCDNGTGVIQANAASEGYFPLCLNPAAGNVAIRHMTPSYPLHVAGSAGNMPAMKYFNSGSTNIASGVNDAITIYASGNIYASGLVAASDERIKKEIIDADDAECLDTLRLLNPKKYRYRDEINRGQEPVWGFIAQEVRETLPYATRLSRQAIPNIYELANVSSSNVITFTNFDTSDLEANATTIQVQTAADMEESVTIAEIIDEHAIRVEEDLSNWTGSVDETGNVVAGNQLFVYGQITDDFVLLKKDAIWTVTTAALQEVDRQQQADKLRIAELETQVAVLLARVTALENA